MTQPSAEKVANFVMAAAAAGAVYYVVRTPRLRRFALGLAVTTFTGTLPLWFSRQVREAWAESGPGRKAER